MKFSPLMLVALTVAAAAGDQSFAAERPGVTATAPASVDRPLMTTPTTVIPRREDLRRVPTAGGGRLIGYTLNLHPGGRAARMLFNR